MIKCWFIHCSACNAEIPDLNRLVEFYGKQNDMLFISLAEDRKKDLINFSKKTEFKYAIIPNQTAFIQDILNINAFPTHILIDKKGNVIKVMDNVNDLMATFIERFAKKPNG